MDYYILDLAVLAKNISKNFDVTFSLKKFSCETNLSYKMNAHSLITTSRNNHEYRIAKDVPEGVELIDIISKTLKKTNAKEILEGVATILVNLNLPEFFEEFYITLIKKLKDMNIKMKMPAWLNIVIEYNMIIKSLDTLKQHIGDVEAISIKFKADNIERTQQLFMMDEKLVEQKKLSKWYQFKHGNKNLMSKIYSNMSECDKLEEKYNQNSVEINSTLSRIKILQLKRDQLKEKITDNFLAINFMI